MRESLLEILAEPTTGAPLRLEAERSAPGGGIRTGLLRSTVSERAYPIVNGIPRFVPSEEYTGSFGFQWNLFREVQLDSANGASYSRRRFDTETGWGAEALSGKRVLDGGCGAGRFAEIAAGYGAELVALDYSSAVDAAQKTLERFPNVDIVQGDLLDPPFRQGAFDFGYSIGVVQHTPDPDRVIANILRCVRPGGGYALTIYGRKPWTKLNGKYLLRPLTRRMSRERLMTAIEMAMPLLFPVTDALYRIPYLGRVAQFTIPVATYVDKPGFTRDQRYREAILDTFDALSPRFDSPMTATEVERVLRSVGAAQIEFKTRVPVNVVGVR